MLFNILLLLILIVLLLILWSIIQKRTHAQQDEEEPLPIFPIPRPKSDFVFPPREEVKIGVERDPSGAPVRITISNPNLTLSPDKQVAWSSEDGKVEIRFQPGTSPFSGTTFVSAKGGAALSGKPRIEAVLSGAQSYLLLFTTPDGFLLKDEARVTVSREEKGY